MDHDPMEPPPGSSIHGILQARRAGCHALLQDIFLTQGSKLHLLHLLYWRCLGSLCWVHRPPFVYPAIHPWMDTLVCFHLLPLTNNNNGVLVHMFYSGLSFFLCMYWGVTWLGHVVTLRSAAEKLSDCLPKLPKHLTFHQLQVRIPVFLSPTQCLFLALISFATHQNVGRENSHLKNRRS